jgi:hypothetical protein
MDFRSILTNFPSGVEKEILAREVGNSKKNFGSLLDLALFENDPIAWRAAWILDASDEQYPGLASGSLSRIIKRLPHLKSTGSLRSLLRRLCRYQIEEVHQGILVNLCFGYMISERYPVAVKVHAMQILYHHVLLYPDLKEELVTLIRDQVSNNSAGFRSRGMKIINQLESSTGEEPHPDQSAMHSS